MKTLANDALSPNKIEDYISIVHDEYGEHAANIIMHYIIVVAAKYLQMMCSYYINENNPEAVEKTFNIFNENFQNYKQIYKNITGEKIIFGSVQRNQLIIKK